MPNVDMCIRLAREDKRWEQYDEAAQAALAILKDCKDRRGIKGQFDSCDEDVLDEIIDSWAEIIRKVSSR